MSARLEATMKATRIAHAEVVYLFIFSFCSYTLCTDSLPTDIRNERRRTQDVFIVPRPIADTRYVAWDDLPKRTRDIAWDLGYGEDQWNTPSTATIESFSFRHLPASAVREPAGLIQEGFGWSSDQWDCYVNHFTGLSWRQLQSEHAQAWSILGDWNEDTWPGGEDVASVGTKFHNTEPWDELSLDRRRAALRLCYRQETWDNMTLPWTDDFIETDFPTPAFVDDIDDELVGTGFPIEDSSPAPGPPAPSEPPILGFEETPQTGDDGITMEDATLFPTGESSNLDKDDDQVSSPTPSPPMDDFPEDDNTLSSPTPSPPVDMSPSFEFPNASDPILGDNETIAMNATNITRLNFSDIVSSSPTEVPFSDAPTITPTTQSPTPGPTLRPSAAPPVEIPLPPLTISWNQAFETVQTRRHLKETSKIRSLQRVGDMEAVQRGVAAHLGALFHGSEALQFQEIKTLLVALESNRATVNSTAYFGNQDVDAEGLESDILIHFSRDQNVQRLQEQIAAQGVTLTGMEVGVGEFGTPNRATTPQNTSTDDDNSWLLWLLAAAVAVVAIAVVVVFAMVVRQRRASGAVAGARTRAASRPKRGGHRSQTEARAPTATQLITGQLGASPPAYDKDSHSVGSESYELSIFTSQ